jgi:hypothetical protein
MTDVYRCKDCNMEFKTRNGLWKHNNNYHKKVAQKSEDMSDNSLKPSETCLGKTDIDIKEYKCKKCMKSFNNRKTKWSHEKKCEVNQNNNDKEDEIEFLKNTIMDMKKQMDILIKQTKINNKTVNNNINKNINNGKIINNNITINAPGHELMSLTKDDVISVFQNNIMSVIKYIEKTNFNKDKTYNHNFCATNQYGKYLLHYDQETSSIKSAKKKYFYESVINNAINKIDVGYNTHKEKFTKKEKVQFEDIISRLKEIRDYDFNNKTLKSLFDELNLLCYNSRDIVLNTWNSMDISGNNMLEVREEYKDIFLPVQEYLEMYHNIKENEGNQYDSDSSDTIKPKLVIRKKGKKSNKTQSSSEFDI